MYSKVVIMLGASELLVSDSHSWRGIYGQYGPMKWQQVSDYESFGVEGASIPRIQSYRKTLSLRFCR